MIEKNRNILEQAIKNMPERKAGSGVWSGIASSLDHQESDLFIKNNVSRLPKHKAPAGVWNGIAGGLKVSTVAGLSAVLLKIAPMFIAGAVLITSMIIFLPAEMEIDKIEQDVTPNSAILDNQNDPAEKKLTSNKSSPGVSIETEPRENEQTIQEDISAIKIDPVNKDALDYTLTPGRKKSSAITASSGEDLQQNYELPVLHSQTEFNVGGKNNMPHSIAFRNKSHLLGRQDDYYSEKRPLDISLGGFYSGVFYGDVNIKDMDIPDMLSSAGMDVMIESGRFYIKSGISYLSWEEKGKYTYNYNKNELVYSYQYVDSARIVPETSMIEYFTTEQDVFDSVAYQKPDAIRKQYKMFRVPLVFGYKLFESRRFTIGINAGIGADIRVGGSEYIPVFNEDQSEITGVENHLLYRSNINWRLIGGMGLYYRLSNRFSLFLEPSYQVYLNDVYQNAQPGRLSYLEIKTGILFKF